MDTIQQALQGTPLFAQWYQWGAVAGFVLALAVTAWKSLAAVASVIGIPALLARFHQGFALEMLDSLSLVLIFSMLGAVLALAAAVGFASTRTRAARLCPVCGQPQDPNWTHCPYHAAPEPVVSV